MYVLGVSCFYHDSSAALLKDGKIVAAAEEERFTRKKHDNSFPENAIKYCLSSEGISANDIDYVGFYEKPLLKFERLLYQHIDSFPKSAKTFTSAMPSWINEKLQVESILRKKTGYKKKILFIEHHLCHAASAFLVSPFRKAAVLTIDGVGEWTTTTYGLCEGSDITLSKEIKFPHSIGLLYSTITAYLGFSVNNSEYKVMGLAAYGNMDPQTNDYYKRLRGIIDIKGDGSFRLDMAYFKYHYADRMPSERLCELLGGPVTTAGAGMEKRHKDIAAAVQLITEEAMTKMLNHIYAQTGCGNIVLAGGVALNSVYNGKILGQTPFKGIWIQPNASDGGTSVGAAAYIYNTLLSKPRDFIMEDAYLGPEFSNDEINKYLDSEKVKYSEFKSGKELVKTTAKLIFENNVLGWFQGRMEWGPRALGARSILSNPCNPEMKKILNLKVKHRERFRPFAPAVCIEDAPKYFECDMPVPRPTDFMLMVYPIKKRYRSKLPAVTHVDGSGRLQTIRRGQNPLYYDLIREFGRLSGVPVLVNTSFNIRGEPIACTPQDAFRCMMGTGIDFLVMGNFLVKRSDNPEKMWDSEKTAKD